MSMELYVLSDKQLTSIDAWQGAIEAKGFPLKLSADVLFADLRGALPVHFADRRTTFECDHRDTAELIANFPDIAFSRRWKYALSFRWGADIDAGASAYMASAAYASATQGELLDCQEGKMISTLRAVEIAHELERSRPIIELAVRKVMEKFQK